MTEASDIDPRVNQHPNWGVLTTERVSARDNRPGLKKMYVTVTDNKGLPLQGIKVRFDTHPSEGIVYDHPNWWGVTNEDGRVEWDHLGKPTRYRLWMEDDTFPLIENIRTDLGNEYHKPEGAPFWVGNRPVNRPGVYSYRFEIRRRW